MKEEITGLLTALTQVTQLRTLPTDPYRLQLASEREIVDKKL